MQTIGYAIERRDLDALIAALSDLRAKYGNGPVLDISCVRGNWIWHGRVMDDKSLIEIQFEVDSAPLDAPEQPC